MATTNPKRVRLIKLLKENPGSSAQDLQALIDAEDEQKGLTARSMKADSALSYLSKTRLVRREKDKRGLYVYQLTGSAADEAAYLGSRSRGLKLDQKPAAGVISVAAVYRLTIAGRTVEVGLSDVQNLYNSLSEVLGK